MIQLSLNVTYRIYVTLLSFQNRPVHEGSKSKENRPEEEKDISAVMG